MPLGYMLGTSIAASVIARLVGLRVPSTLIFAGLFALQTTLFTVYAVFIYPFYLSPFRHLPSPAGALPLVGHGRDLRRFGPGLMARKWCARPLPSPFCSILRSPCLALPRLSAGS